MALRKLSACLLNISEAQNQHVVEQIAKAAIVNAFSKEDQEEYVKVYLDNTTSKTIQCSPLSTSTINRTTLQQLESELFGNCYKSQTAILNIFSDPIYNRSVITIAGTLPGVEKGVIAACSEAFRSLKDIHEHRGGHPRKGIIDLIPIHPISKHTSLEDCAWVAVRISQQLKMTKNDKAEKNNHENIDTFLFGHADIPLKRSLVAMRKHVNWYSSNEKDCQLKKYGLTGIGAIPYMTNFNVTLKDGIDLKVGRKVAARIRHSNPDETGCLGVQSMAFDHKENRIEIACNVDLLEYDSSNTRHVQAMKNNEIVIIFDGKYFMTRFEVIQRKIEEVATEVLTKDYGSYQNGKFTVVEDSVIIGFTPNEIETRALDALSLKTTENWNNFANKQTTETKHM